MSELGQSRRSGGRLATSDPPRYTDILSVRRHVSKVPEAAVHCAGPFVLGFAHSLGLKTSTVWPGKSLSRNVVAGSVGKKQIWRRRILPEFLSECFTRAGKMMTSPAV